MFIFPVTGYIGYYNYVNCKDIGIFYNRILYNAILLCNIQNVS